ncbi:hypothetical protein AB0383_11340 [Amycolatopsis sp. NPDC051373]|uniref:hypothetical protein n=1 Tax=Amycolatopsis sp. NPDC051373 TaxID=3155801 RepID=UPI00344CFCCB
MTVDARQFYWTAPPFEEQPLFRAADDVVAGWMELANHAQSELEGFGIPATVLVADDRVGLGADPGAQLIVCNARPFGVILTWEPSIRGTEEFRNIVLNRSTTSPLLRYVAEGRNLMTEACMAVLSAAGFSTARDHFEGTGYDYRVLFAPQIPIIERE